MLGRLVRLMLLLLVLGFFAVLFASLDTRIINRVGAPDSSRDAALFADIPPGQTQMRRHRNQRVWVTHLDDSLRVRLALLEKAIPNPQQGCSETQEFCIVSALTQRSGIDIVYSPLAPPSLSSKLPWVGGFTNPVTGQSYDLLGRAYASDTSALTVLD